MLIDASLWSADLGSLRESVKRVSRLVDSFHVDVADGHFAAALLFFPDLIEAVREVAGAPFHFHLMVERPRDWVASFGRAGDLVSVHAEAERAAEAMGMARASGCRAGVAARLSTDVMALQKFRALADAVLLLGTDVGVKGKALDPRACDRIRQVREILPGIPVYADGGIRPETVPLLRQAGAAAVVPGSLLFGSEDMEAVSTWLRSL